MMHFQEIVVHAAVTPKQIAIVLYIFASVLYPIKAETNSDTATQVNIPYKIRNTVKRCCNIIDTETQSKAHRFTGNSGAYGTWFIIIKRFLIIIIHGLFPQLSQFVLTKSLSQQTVAYRDLPLPDNSFSLWMVH